MKESAEEENKEALAGRAFLVFPPTNQTQRRRRLWFWVISSVERKREEDEEKRLEIEKILNAQLQTKNKNAHPFSEHVNGHRLFLSW
jgi:hypothetical protein